MFFACLGTVACGLSTNMESLIAARFVRIAFDYVGRFVLTFSSWLDSAVEASSRQQRKVKTHLLQL